MTQFQTCIFLLLPGVSVGEGVQGDKVVVADSGLVGVELRELTRRLIFNHTIIRGR